MKKIVKELRLVQRSIAVAERILRDFAGTAESKSEVQNQINELRKKEENLQITIMRNVGPAITAPNDYDIIVDALINNIDRHTISQQYGIPYTSVIHKVSTALHCTIT